VPEADPNEAATEGVLGFCVTANVAAETSHGDSGLDVRSGVQHFSA